MLLASALLALAPPHPLPLAPPPHAARGWVARHTFTHKAAVTAVTATADGYVTGDAAGVLLLWDARTGKRRGTLLDGTDDTLTPVTAVRPTPDGKRLNVVANGAAGQIELTGQERTFHGMHRGWATLAIGEDGLWLVNSGVPQFGGLEALCLARRGFQANISELSTVHVLRHTVAVRLAARAPDLIASVDIRHTVHGWKVTPGAAPDQPTWSVDLSRLEPTALAVSPDGTLVAVAAAAGTVVLSAKKGATVATLKGHAGAVRAVAFAPDSGLIATGGADGTVRLWNPWSGEEEGRLNGHTGRVGIVWFASDDVLMTAGDDQTARVWAYQP